MRSSAYGQSGHPLRAHAQPFGRSLDQPPLFLWWQVRASKERCESSRPPLTVESGFEEQPLPVRPANDFGAHRDGVETARASTSHLSDVAIERRLDGP
jgi:hypothetical protein